MQITHPLGSAYFKSLFLLRPDIHFLNFGSFGACPKVIFEDYQNWQRLLESEPVQFIAAEGPKLLAHSRGALAHYIGCAADDVVYVTNPTYAVNIVAKSLQLEEGDEILTTNIEYGACDKTWDFYCTKARAKYVRSQVHLPMVSEEEFIENFMANITDRTVLVFISHITSATGLRLPVEKLIPLIHAKGIPVFVDGAHAPGHIPLNLASLDADYYTGACHKWMMTAKGSSFLYVKPSLQSALEPLLVSWGYNSAKPSSSQFLDYHQMQGTRDFSAFLTIPKAIEFMAQENWLDVSRLCREKTREMGSKLCAILSTQPLAPLDDRFFGQLFSCPIQTTQPEELQRKLFENFRIEIPIMVQDRATYMRISVQAFNDDDDYLQLFEAVHQLKTQGLL